MRIAPETGAVQLLLFDGDGQAGLPGQPLPMPPLVRVVGDAGEPRPLALLDGRLTNTAALATEGRWSRSTWSPAILARRRLGTP